MQELAWQTANKKISFISRGLWIFVRPNKRGISEKIHEVIMMQNSGCPL